MSHPTSGHDSVVILYWLGNTGLSDKYDIRVYLFTTLFFRVCIFYKELLLCYDLSLF